MINAKQCLDGRQLENPALIASDIMTNNIALLPSLSIFDIYNYLAGFDEFEHSTFRDFKKMESYTLAIEGYVIDIEIATYRNDVFALRSQVEPRTSEKDPT